MSRQFVQEINPIPKRANMKILNQNGRYFMIGGMTVDKITADIFQFKIHQEEEKLKVQWRPLKFQNNIFKPINSFSACCSKSHIYIWGGLQVNQTQTNQKTISDLIQIDVQNYKMRLIPLSQKISIHSAVLAFDQINKQLIAYGGTNQSSSLQAYLYTLDMSQNKNQYTWNKKSINKLHNGYIWQHSGCLLSRSLFSKKQGRYFLIVGGCRYPQSPYKEILEIDLNKLQITNKIQLEEGLVAHQVILNQNNQSAYIIGGANGGGFNRFIFILQEGKIKKIQGHNAVGCGVLYCKSGLLVYGGVCGPEHLNAMIFYKL